MEYKDIKDKLPKATQYICAQVSVQHRYYRNAGEKLQSEVKSWLKDIQEGRIVPSQDGTLPGIRLIYVKCKGRKEVCQQHAVDARFHERSYGSTDRLIQLGMWSNSWRVLPANERGEWVPGGALIKKVLESL